MATVDMVCWRPSPVDVAGGQIDRHPSESEPPMRHRVTQGAIGLVAGLATICLLSLPTSATTATLEFVNVTGTTPGSINVFNEDSELVTSIPVPGPTTLTCSLATNPLTVTTTGT